MNVTSGPPSSQQEPGTAWRILDAPARMGQCSRDASQTWGGTIRLCMIRLCNPSAVAVILLLNARR